MSLWSLLGSLGMGGGLAANEAQKRSLHEFSARDVDGNERSLSEFKGKVVLIVNVASQCGFTGQYEGLQKLYSTYKDKGFVILGFPSNDFGGQEPGSDKEIKFFCQENYKVGFPIFSKSSVKGDAINPVFDFLTKAAGGRVLWNFEKFLVGKDGKFIDRWRSVTSPDSKRITKAIEKALAS